MCRFSVPYRHLIYDSYESFWKLINHSIFFFEGVLCDAFLYDGWVMGISGSYEETQSNLEKVKTFCLNTMKLNVNESMTRITNRLSKSIPFT